MTECYLVNGKNGVGNAVCLCIDGKQRKAFGDISALDLQTMKIPYKQARSILSTYNNGIDLSGKFYDVVNSRNGNCYVTIFDISSDKTKYYFNALRRFAEKREEKVKNKEKVKLDIDQQLYSYIERILYEILSRPMNQKLIDYSSIMSYKTKELINERYTKHGSMGTKNYIDSRMAVFENLFSSYTELRNITFEYICYLEGLKVDARRHIETVSKWQQNGLHEDFLVNLDDEIYKYRQYELSDFIDINTGLIRKK